MKKRTENFVGFPFNSMNLNSPGAWLDRARAFAVEASKALRNGDDSRFFLLSARSHSAFKRSYLLDALACERAGHMDRAESRLAEALEHEMACAAMTVRWQAEQ